MSEDGEHPPAKIYNNNGFCTDLFMYVLVRPDLIWTEWFLALVSTV